MSTNKQSHQQSPLFDKRDINIKKGCASKKAQDNKQVVHDEENQVKHTRVSPPVSPIPRPDPNREANQRELKQSQARLMIISSIILICSAIYRRYEIDKTFNDSFQTRRSPGPATFLFVGIMCFLGSSIPSDADLEDSEFFGTSISYAGGLLFLIGAFSTFLFLEEKDDIGRWIWRREVWITGSAILIVSNIFMFIVERILKAGIMTLISLGFGLLGNVLFLSSAVLTFENEKQKEAANCFIAGGVLYLLEAICSYRSIDSDNVLPFSSFFRRLFSFCSDEPDDPITPDDESLLWISSLSGKVFDPDREQNDTCLSHFVHSLACNPFCFFLRYSKEKEEWFKGPSPNATSPAGSNEIFEYYKWCRDIIKEENQLINHRMTWFLQFQGFLFLSASGFAMKTDPFFRIIVAFPGLISGIFFVFAMKDAESSMKTIQNNMKIISRKYDCVPFYPVRGTRSGWSSVEPKVPVIALITLSWLSIIAYSIAIIVFQGQENGIDSFFLEKAQTINVQLQ